MTPDWVRIYKTLDTMRYAVRNRVRMLFGEGHPDEPHLVNRFCAQVWDAAGRYAVQHEVFVKGANLLEAEEDGVEHYRPPDTTSPRVVEMEQRLKDVLGDLLEGGDRGGGRRHGGGSLGQTRRV